MALMAALPILPMAFSVIQPVTSSWVSKTQEGGFLPLLATSLLLKVIKSCHGSKKRM